jgi:signal transduction histidine kinase
MRVTAAPASPNGGAEPEPSTGNSTPQPPASAPTVRSSWRLRNWRLGSKLVIILLVPSLSTIALAGLRLSSQLDDAQQFTNMRRDLGVANQTITVADLLQAERNAVVSYIAAGRTDQAPKFEPTEAAVDKLRGRANGVTGPVANAVGKALNELDELSALRNSSLTTRLPDVAALTSYTETIDSLTQIVRVTAANVSDPALSQLDSSLRALTDAMEQLTLQSTIVVSAALHKRFPPDLVNQLRATQARYASDLEDFTNSADADNRQLFHDTVSGPDVDERNRVVQLALVQSDAGQPITVSPNNVQHLTATTAALVTKVLTHLHDQSDSVLADLIRQARMDAFRDTTLVVLSLAIALLLTVFVARSMLVPLRVLRRSALEVARTRLPAAIERILHDREAESQAVEPVPVHTTEEVGQVARAFDAVQREAIRLATEQAALRGNVNAMFVNLSRRGQALVARQISVIDRLERDEQDPDQLASLFELDHLATRMRRNSENLLVLAGTALTRRVTRPVAVAEVLGAAVSEVEKYARVRVAPAPDLTIQGWAVNDITHLIAELLDNATAFSPPTTKVTVQAAKTRRDELAIEIHDRGVGMGADELEAANQRLADPPEVDVTASRQMGLFVVAQLAKRHDVKVRLRDNDDGGVTAYVVVPATLVAAATARTPLPGPDRPRDIVGLPKWNPTQPQPVVTAKRLPDVEGTEDVDLFAPHRKAQPAKAEPEVTPASGVEPWPAPQRRFDYDDPPTERLPIYQEVLSRWFEVPEDGESVPVPRGEAPTSDGEAAAVDNTAVKGEDDSWHSAGDEGWQAVESLLAEEPETVTDAGLPRRVPRSQLVPGSARTKPPAARAPVLPRRSPEARRDRMATYQHGVSLGRRSGPGGVDEAIDAGYRQHEQEHDEEQA